MLYQFIVLGCSIIISLILPKPIMNYKRKEDICSKETKIVSTVVSEIALALAGTYLAISESGHG